MISNQLYNIKITIPFKIVTPSDSQILSFAMPIEGSVYTYDHLKDDLKGKRPMIMQIQ